jgi:dihydrofolate reductase
VAVAGSVDEALEIADSRRQDAFIAGGAEVYRQTLKIADRIEVTEVDQSPEGDTWFPTVDWANWREVARHVHPGFTFVTYDRT